MKQKKRKKMFRLAVFHLVFSDLKHNESNNTKSKIEAFHQRVLVHLKQEKTYSLCNYRG